MGQSRCSSAPARSPGPDRCCHDLAGLDPVIVTDERAVTLGRVNSTTDVRILEDSLVGGARYFPWCDGLALDDEHTPASGHTGPQDGRLSVIDLFQQPQSSCTGAPNSVGSGAALHVTGSASLAAKDLELWTVGLPPGLVGLFDYGGPASTGGAITVGSTWNFQFTYRDPAGGGGRFNLSDAVAVDLLP